MNLYTKLEIKGEIKNLYAIGRKKTPFKSGVIYTYRQGDDKKFDFFNLFFISFGDVAEKLEEANLHEGSIVTMNGSLKENSYNGKKTMQLIIASFQVEKEYPSGNNTEEEYTPVSQRQAPKKANNPYRNATNTDVDEDDDLPI